MPLYTLLEPSPSGVNYLYTLFLLFYLLVHGIIAIADRDADLLVTIVMVGVVFLGFPWAIHWAFSLLIEEASERRRERNGENLVRNNLDSDDGRGCGVTKEAKKNWKLYEWGDNILSETTSKHEGMPNYGSTSCSIIPEEEIEEGDNQDESVSKLENGQLNEREPCSICLGEYEIGEKMVQLPCEHTFHKNCINSWTANHVRCPLCNCNLMETLVLQ